jgi:hypothetical protein
VQDDAVHLDLFLARWVRWAATPEDAVRLATHAVEQGCSDHSIAVIAGSRATTRGEIEEELPRVLRVLRTRLPSRDEALKTLVDDCARQIAAGRIDPVHGAWSMFDFSTNEDESPEFYDQVRRFIDLAWGEDDAGPDLTTYRDEIVAEARAFLERGGLRVPDPNA